MDTSVKKDRKGCNYCLRYKAIGAVESNDIFTIEYDSAHQKDPQLLCFKEDETPLKWLFHESDLIVLEENK